MSGIAGIFRFAGRPGSEPIDAALLERMTRQLAHRGPDGIGYWVGGNAALAHAALHTTPESIHEVQPHTDETGAFRLSFDGRVDNRDELRDLLLGMGLAPRNDTDVELVLRAYIAWQEACPARILGDFSFAVWDGKRRQLFCARDRIGLRPFYYSLAADQFLFASEQRALFESPSLSSQPNEAMVAGYLLGDIRNNEETLYRQIRRLPPAHCMVVSASGLRLRRYWAPDPAHQVRHKSDEDYAEHFRELFRAAVACRLRSSGRVGAFLSGGLDSSSIVAMALQVLDNPASAADNPVARDKLAVLAVEFPGLSCDESYYIRDVQAHTGHPVAMFTTGGGGAEMFIRQAARDMDFPGYPNGDVFFQPMYQRLASEGIRTVLFGQGGDEWFTGSLRHYADYLKQLKLGKIARQFIADRWQSPKEIQFQATSLSTRRIIRAGIAPLLSSRTRALLRRSFAGPMEPPDWLGDSLRATLPLQPQEGVDATDWPGFASHAQQDIAAMLNQGWMIQNFEVAERTAAHWGFEYRSPFQDLHLIEFGLGLPEDQRWRGRWTKFVMRQGMRGLIPESVRTRTDKMEFSHLVAESLLELWKRGICKSMRMAELGWVKPAELQRALEEFERHFLADDLRYRFQSLRLWMILALELWVRGLDGRGPFPEDLPNLLQ